MKTRKEARDSILTRGNVKFAGGGRRRSSIGNTKNETSNRRLFLRNTRRFRK